MSESPTDHGWRRDADWKREIKRTVGDAGPQGDFECWRRGKLQAIVSRDDIAERNNVLFGGLIPDPRWHISLAHADRVPSWEELSRAGHELRPGVTFVVGVPPRSWWINVHPNVLHLYELKDQNLEDQWRFERRGDART
jgi:hypothetical protein